MTKSLSDNLYKGFAPVSAGGTGGNSTSTALAGLGAQAKLVSGTNIKTINGNSVLAGNNFKFASLTPTAVKTSLYSASASDLVRCNTSGGVFTVNLPALPSDGTVIGFSDVNSTFGTSAVTVVPSGATIESDTSLILNIPGINIVVIYNLINNNWEVLHNRTTSFGRIPDAPTIGTATVNQLIATVPFTAPTFNGNATIIKYTATSSPGGKTGSITQAGSGSVTVTGLSYSTNYTFTVVATNEIGDSIASTSSNSVIITVPTAPTVGTVTLSGFTATIPFSAQSNGGSDITSYTAYSNDKTVTLYQSASGTFTIPLTYKTLYTFNIVATNNVGSSTPAVAGNSVIVSGVIGNTTSNLTTPTTTNVATCKLVGGTTTITLSFNGYEAFLLSTNTTTGITTLSSTTQINSRTNNVSFSAMVALTSTTAMISYFSNISGTYTLYAKLLTISGTSVTAGSDLFINTNSGYPSLAFSTPTSAILSYVNGSTTVTAVGLYISGGTTLASTASVDITTSNPGAWAAVTVISSTIGIVAYSLSSGGVGARVITIVSGTTVSSTLGAQVTIGSGMGNKVGINGIFNSGSAVLVYGSNSGVFSGLAANVLTVSGTTITVGATTIITSSSGTSNPSILVTNSGANAIVSYTTGSIGYANVLSISGTTISVTDQRPLYSTGYTTSTPGIININGTQHIIYHNTSSSYSDITLIDVATVNIIAQQSYTVAGTYSWICPTGITSVSVLCVGAGGGGGGGGSSTYGAGGGGGSLAYANNITVVPGNTYTVVIGAAGTAGAANTSGGNGGASYFNSNTYLQAGGGGGGGGGASYATAGANGTPSGTALTTGNNGGAGGAGNNSGAGSGGGGGAAGYAGSGGNGSIPSIATAANSGAGGGGGGGSNGAGGGGVGLLGQGSNGAGGVTLGSAGSNGSGGVNGTALSGNTAGGGGAYGGGGGGGQNGSFAGAAGSVGAVRIIWPGDARQFPSTNTVII